MSAPELNLRIRRTHYAARGGPTGTFILCGAATTTNQTRVWSLVDCPDCIDRESARAKPAA